MRCGFEKRATASELGAAVHAEWSINGCRHAVNQFVTQNRNRFTTHTHTLCLCVQQRSSREAGGSR